MRPRSSSVKKVSQNQSDQHHQVFQYLEQRASAVNSVLLCRFFSNLSFYGIILVLLFGGNIPAQHSPLVLTFRTTTPTRTLTFFHGESEQPHYVKNACIWSYSGPNFSRIFSHSDWIRRDTSYLSVCTPNAGKCRKYADQNNSEYGHFLRSAVLMLTCISSSLFNFKLEP